MASVWPWWSPWPCGGRGGGGGGLAVVVVVRGGGGEAVVVVDRATVAYAARMQAYGYTWGWFDAGGEHPDVGMAEAFTEAWSQVVTMEDSRDVTWRPSLQDAWQLWLSSGRLPYAGSGFKYMVMVAVEAEGYVKVEIQVDLNRERVVA